MENGPEEEEDAVVESYLEWVESGRSGSNVWERMVVAMDPNATILIELARLRGISASFRGGDEIRRSLTSTMDAIVDTISQSTNILYDITSYRERKRREQEDGLDYVAIRRLKITKKQIFALFSDPRTGEIPNANRPHISIEWCTFQPFIDNWMDRWYMVFDSPPHNNREMLLYFLRKLYAEFVLHRHVNYFSYLEFQGIGGGMPQNRLNARVQDPNRPILALRAPLHGLDVPPATRVVAETRNAFLTLARVVLRHSTTLQQMGGDAGPSGHDARPLSSSGPLSSSRPSSSAGPSTGAPPPTDAGPSTSAPPSAHPQQSFDPHECTSCGCPCYGLSTDVAFSGFLSELLRFDARDPPDFGLGHGIAATDPFVGGGIHDGTGPFGSTEIQDPSLGGEIHETHHGTQASTQTSGPLPADASPPRPSVDKGRVYMRRSTPKKTRVSHGHGVTEPMEPELTEESLVSMVDAAIDAASSMAASHTEAPAAGVVPAPLFRPQLRHQQQEQFLPPLVLPRLRPCHQQKK